MNAPEPIHCQIRVTPDLYKQLRLYAVEHDVSVPRLMATWVAERIGSEKLADATVYQYRTQWTIARRHGHGSHPAV